MVHCELHFRTKVRITDVVYVRYRWLALIVVVVVAACGQPLQINTPSSPRTTRTAGPLAASPAIDATPATAVAETAPSTNRPTETSSVAPATPTILAAPTALAPTPQ